MAMSQNMIADRQKQIFDAITMMRGLQPKILPFAICWNQLRQQRPELFADMDDADPSPAGPPSSVATQEMSERLKKRDALSLAAAMAVLRAQARGATVHAERPSEEVTVVGGFFKDLRSGHALIQCEDGSIRDLG